MTKNMTIAVRSLLSGMNDPKDREKAEKALSGKDFDVFDAHENLLPDLRGCIYVMKPDYSTLKSFGSCMFWGGSIASAVLLKNNKVHVEFDAVFLITFSDWKFTLFRHDYSHRNGKPFNDLVSEGRPLLLVDMYNGFNIISSRGYFFTNRLRIVSSEIVRGFVYRCISVCFHPYTVKLFNQIVDENCCALFPINGIIKPNYRSKRDIITKKGKIKGIPKNINKYNINVGFAIREASEYLSRDSLARLYGKENSERLLECLVNNNDWEYRPESPKRYLLEGLARFLYPNIDMNVVIMYLSICRKNNMHADIRITNEHTMLRKIDPYYEDSPSESLNVAPQYEKLEDMLGCRYHLIRTEDKLRLEGSIQRNCVYTYADAIRSGYCGIFTLTENGSRYTIEINYRGREYSCNQFLGFANSSTYECQSLHNELCRKLDEINRKLAQERSLQWTTDS